jgi:hypothetical protein
MERIDVFRGRNKRIYLEVSETQEWVHLCEEKRPRDSDVWGVVRVGVPAGSLAKALNKAPSIITKQVMG